MSGTSMKGSPLEWGSSSTATGTGRRWSWRGDSGMAGKVGSDIGVKEFFYSNGDREEVVMERGTQAWQVGLR